MQQPSAIRAVDYKELKVISPVFQHESLIPSKYTCEGENISPPLQISFIPGEAKSLVLIVDDPDAPNGSWMHWLVWDIPVTHLLKEGEVHGIEGINDFKQHRYGGPCPPSGTHRYFFKIYALDKLLKLPTGSTKAQLEKLMSGHILAFGELIGLYKRKML
ncbi:MAG: YbhB/YbcL family Raf kinase inhibitor-like protein [Chitinophagales bacterium]|nr:YbhB/YbcL family Raf kinase inhibitor-like protein [Chitinophagales bacterium]